MTMIDEYITKGNRVINNGDEAAIDSVAREIISVFSTEIPNLAHYRGARISADASNSEKHTASDLKKLIGKLRVLQEKKDETLYANLGLASLTDSIRMLENAVAENQNEEQLDKLFKLIDPIYANRYKFYVIDLCGYNYSDEKPSITQAELRIRKLRDFRDQELRDLRLAEAKAASIELNQNQQANATATAISVATTNLFETYEAIDAISGDELSDEDKEKLKGLLASFGQSASKGKDDKKGKLTKVLEFIADKGTDVFIAAAPYLWGALQQLA